MKLKNVLKEEFFKSKQIILLDENLWGNIQEKYMKIPKQNDQTNYYGRIGSLLSYANPFK